MTAFHSAAVRVLDSRAAPLALLVPVALLFLAGVPEPAQADGLILH